ncbi:hypothetical protein [Sinomicrobium sp. M5D2P9]
MWALDRAHYRGYTSVHFWRDPDTIACYTYQHPEAVQKDQQKGFILVFPKFILGKQEKL